MYEYYYNNIIEYNAAEFALLLYSKIAQVNFLPFGYPVPNPDITDLLLFTNITLFTLKHGTAVVYPLWLYFP